MAASMVDIMEADLDIMATDMVMEKAMAMDMAKDMVMAEDMVMAAEDMVMAKDMAMVGKAMDTRAMGMEEDTKARMEAMAKGC